jgi:hypothetical protein
LRSTKSTRKQAEESRLQGTWIPHRQSANSCSANIPTTGRLSIRLDLGWVCWYMGQNDKSTAVFTHLLARGGDRLEALAEPGMAPLEVLGALANLPATFVKIDVLSELDKLVRRHGQRTAEFANTAAVRVAALDKVRHHEEAWGHAVAAKRVCFRRCETSCSARAKGRRRS